VVSLSAIVPATDRPATLARCLAAIRAAEPPPDQLVVVEEPAGLGPAGARNAGARRAFGDVLVFVDSDVLVHRDAFRRIRDAFQHEPELAALFGAYDDRPEAAGAVSGFRNLLHHHVHHSSPGPAETFWAGLGAVRREAFTAVGGFDELRYRVPSVEDIELGLRLRAAGGPIRLDPCVQGTHLKAWTLASMLRTDVAARGVPWVELMARERRAPGHLNLAWRHRASALASVAALACLASGRPGRGGACLLALVALNRGFYALLLDRRGPAETSAGVCLHALHHLAAVVSVPVGLAAHLAARRRAGDLASR
jgi:GT2 family glycosyltransferase